MAKKHPNDQAFATNRKALRNYLIIDKFEAGIQLMGTEVKSIRNSQVSIDEGFIMPEGEELYIHKMHVMPYTHANQFNHDPIRLRKLLLKKFEIRKIIDALQQKGYALIPLRVYAKNGFIKVQIALGKGKDTVDKREDLKRKTADRETARAISDARKR
jgi:SsrA-binding protein